MKKKVILTVLLTISIFISIKNFAIIETQGDRQMVIEVFTNKKIFWSKEAVIIHIKVTNPTDSPITLYFSTSHQFDYEIKNIFGQTLYRWGANKMFLQVVTKIKILPKTSFIANFTHRPSDFLLGSGVYSIEGVVVGYGSDVTWLWVDIISVMAIGISVIAIVVILVLVIRRKKKKGIEESGQSLLK